MRQPGKRRMHSETAIQRRSDTRGLLLSPASGVRATIIQCVQFAGNVTQVTIGIPVNSATQRTLKYLRGANLLVGKVGDFWNQYARVRQDLWGFGDFLCARKEAGDPMIFIVQSTSGTGHSARRKKILSIPAAKHWIQAGGGIVVISWSKKGERGKRKLWDHRAEWITVDDFEKS